MAWRYSLQPVCGMGVIDKAETYLVDDIRNISRNRRLINSVDSFIPRVISMLIESQLLIYVIRQNSSIGYVSSCFSVDKWGIIIAFFLSWLCDSRAECNHLMVDITNAHSVYVPDILLFIYINSYPPGWLWSRSEICNSGELDLFGVVPWINILPLVVLYHLGT